MQFQTRNLPVNRQVVIVNSIRLENWVALKSLFHMHYKNTELASFKNEELSVIMFHHWNPR